MRYSIIVAVAENGVMGRDGGMPWRLSSDLKTFRRLTMGKPLVMGRRTFQSLAGPLDGRDNVVVTRDKDFRSDGVLVSHSVDDALEIARQCAEKRGVSEVMVIGGAEIYAQALPKVTRIYQTLVHGSPDGDTHFPPLNPSDWQEIEAQDFQPGPKDDYAFRFSVLERC